jgi:cytochrome P450
VPATVTEQGIYWDPYDRELLADPYPALRRLRDEAPLYYNEAYDFYAVTRFDDVLRAFGDNERFLNCRGTNLDMVQSGRTMPSGTLVGEDAPSHGIHRRLLSRVFTPKAMLAIEPEVRAFCAQRLDQLAGRDGFDGFDVAADFAEYVPMRVFGMLLGISEADQERVVAYVEERMNAGGGGPKTYEEGFLSGEFYAEFVDHALANPGDDLITRLVTTEFTDDLGVERTLTRSEALTYLMVLAGAGNHTTKMLITWAAKVLGEHPDARRELVADPSLIPNAIEELLRFEPSSTQAARWVATDVEIHGQTVPAGSALLCVVGSANRDERVFDDPDTFDVHRRIGRHLTFGYGPHFCLGASLARLEGRVALEELLKRFPDWELDMAAAELGNSTGVRGYASLPITVP